MRNVIAFVASAALLTACGSDTGPDEALTVSGSMSVSYTGAGSASSTPFSANGTSPSDTTSFGSTAWAGGSTETANQLGIIGVSPVSANTWNIVVLTIAGQSTGTFDISPTTCSSACTSVSFIAGATGTPESFSTSSFTFLCTLSSGAVTVASINSNTATGSFSGSGTCFSSTGTPTVFSMANGSFNVGLTSSRL